MRTLAAALLLLVLAVGAVALVPLPPDRILSAEPSPDGAQVAVFSWRPAGLLGLNGDNPWVYLTIRERDSGIELERFSTWGDVPTDAYDRLAKHVPWHEGS